MLSEPVPSRDEEVQFVRSREDAVFFFFEVGRCACALELGVCGWGQPGGDEALGAGKGEGGLGEEDGGEVEGVGGRGHEYLLSFQRSLLREIREEFHSSTIRIIVKCRVVPAKQSIRVSKLDLKGPSVGGLSQ